MVTGKGSLTEYLYWVNLNIGDKHQQSDSKCQDILRGIVDDELMPRTIPKFNSELSTGLDIENDLEQRRLKV